MANKEILGGFFDGGDVLYKDLIKENHEYISDTFGIGFVTYTTIWEDHIHKPFGTGEMTEQEFYEILRKQTGSTFSPKQSLFTEFSEMHANALAPNEEVIKILAEMTSAGYKLGIISNSYLPLATFNMKIGMYDPFSIKILSHEVGIRKPDEVMYRLALKEMQVEPEESFFVDDKEANVIAARKIGMKGIVFKTASILRQDLKDIAVKIT